jgi:MFS family permease
MSQGNDRDDETATARPVTLELYLDGTPANDVAPPRLPAQPHLAAPPRLPAPPRLGAGPLGLAPAYWVLWTGMLLNRLGGTVFFLLGIYLTRDRQMSPVLAGLVISLYAAGGLLAGPIGGTLADRAGRRATLLAGTTIAGTLMLALGVARSTAAIVAIAPCLAFFTDLCRPPLQAAVADIVPPADRARAYGLLNWAINLGFAGAASFGGVLADHHFTLLFVIDAGTTLAYGAFIFLGLPETRPAVTTTGGGAGASVRAGFTAPFGDRRFVRFTLIQLLLLLAFAQVVMTLPLDMHAHGLSTARIGWLLSLNGALIVIFQPIALRALRGFGLRYWLAVGAALVGIGLGTTAFAGSAPTPVYALAVVVWTLGEIGFATAAPTFVAELAPIDRRGTYQGTYQLAWGAACTAAPALGSLVLVHLGSGALWIGCLGLCLAAAGLHLRFTERGR